MEYGISCPHCGKQVTAYRNPIPTADVLIYVPGQGVLLIERGNPPHGWALPGGFVDYGESAEAAAIREAREETGLAVRLTGLLGVYSKPGRDPRHHTLTVVYTAETPDPSALNAGDDASKAAFWPLDALPAHIAFDHREIIDDFIARNRHTMQNTV